MPGAATASQIRCESGALRSSGRATRLRVATAATGSSGRVSRSVDPLAMRAPRLDHPEVAGQLVGDVQDGVAVSFDDHVESGGDGRRRVDDDEVTGMEMFGKRPERGVHRGVEPTGHEQAHLVATQATRLGWLVGLVLGVEREAQG